MLPPNLITALQALSRGGKPPATELARNPVVPVEPGQQVKGEVQAQVGKGVFKVLVAGQSLQMHLPPGLRAGDVVNLRVVSKYPQLTFSISPSTAPISTQEQISATAHLLANLTGEPLERQALQKLSRSMVSQTLVSAPEGKQLAVALKDALSNSGLFYESHQAQWVRGERSTANLLVEPQNRLMDKSTILPTPNSTLSRLAEMMTKDQTSVVALHPEQNMNKADEPLSIPKELYPLVQQQLHALETHQIIWTGAVWPGQEMQWEIQGEPEHTSEQQDEKRWSTEMELALPKLGDVHAKLQFTRDGLELILQAADSATLDVFTRNIPKLKSALDDVHVSLLSTVIEKS